MSEQTVSPVGGRLAALRQRLDAAELSALLVTHLPNVFYLTGFSGSAGGALVTPDAVRLIVDSQNDEGGTAVGRPVVTRMRPRAWRRNSRVIRAAGWISHENIDPASRWSEL